MKNRIIAACAAALLGLMIVPAAASAQTGAEKQQAQVLTLLGGIEAEPTHEQFVALGPDTPLILAEIAQDRTQTPVTRARAISALRNYRSEVTNQTLRVLIIDPQTPVLLRRKAIFSIAKTEGSECLELLKPYLAASTYELREASIQAIGSLNTSESKSALQSRLPFEKSSDLQKAIAEALATPVKTPALETK